MKNMMTALVTTAALGFGMMAKAEPVSDGDLASHLPAKLTCKQVVAVYGRYASDRVRTVPTVTMERSESLFVTKGSLDNEVVITLSIDGEQVTDLIFTLEDLKASKAGTVNMIRGQYRESASYHDSWVDALTVVDCQPF